MNQYILRHKLRFLIVILSIAGITADELLKALLMQYILDSAIAGAMERFCLSCILTAGIWFCPCACICFMIRHPTA